MRRITLCAGLVLAVSVGSMRAQMLFRPAPGESHALVTLPEAPGASYMAGAGVMATHAVAPCSAAEAANSLSSDSDDADSASDPCANSNKRLAVSAPLTAAQRAEVAFHHVKDPGNLATIFGTAAFAVATNAHTAYGPGMRGFGKNAGVSLLQDATGEFFGTFLIPSLTLEDTRYHRMPHASVSRRFLHALAHTLVARHDDGTAMLNYATLLTYPICAEISNLYVPGIHGDGPSTVARVMIGYATDPIENEVNEFLPDVAKHIHFHIIFVQRVLNQVASDQYSLP